MLVNDPGIATAAFADDGPASAQAGPAPAASEPAQDTAPSILPAFDSGKLLLTQGVSNIEGAAGGGLASWAVITTLIVVTQPSLNQALSTGRDQIWCPESEYAETCEELLPKQVDS